MTRAPMTCDQFADAVADYLDRRTDAATTARVEAHAVACIDCGGILAIRIDAANLEELEPSRDLWPEIAARIETPVVVLPSATGSVAAHANHADHAALVEPIVAAPRGRSRLWQGLAAAGLVIVTVAITRKMTQRDQPIPAPVTHVAQVSGHDSATSVTLPSPTPTPATVPGLASVVASNAKPAAKVSVASKRTPAVKSSTPSTSASASASRGVLVANSAQNTYDKEIARLRVVVNRRRGQLDSATVATIEKNLVVIDQAITQCKQALAQDPASRFLMESLNGAMDTKVQLLRTAAMLPSAM